MALFRVIFVINGGKRGLLPPWFKKGGDPLREKGREMGRPPLRKRKENVLRSSSKGRVGGDNSLVSAQHRSEGGIQSL